MQFIFSLLVSSFIFVSSIFSIENENDLFHAINQDSIESLEVLLENGANVNLFDPETGWTPLHFAAAKGNIEIIKLLIDNKADIYARDAQKKNTPIQLAILNSKYDATEFLLKKGGLKYSDDLVNGNSLLHIASMTGHYSIVELLLNHKININLRNYSNQTSLHIAAAYGHYSIVKLLIEKGTDMEAFDNNGASPLHLASKEGKFNIIRILSKKMKSIDIKDNNGATPLHYSLNNKQYNVSKYLLKKGANKQFPSDGRFLINISDDTFKDYLKKIPQYYKEDKISECKSILDNLYDMDTINTASIYNKSKIFEKIYQREHSKPYFLDCLDIYVDNDSEKIYWIGIFLFETNYTQIKNYQLAERYLSKGIQLGDDESTKVSTYYMLGLIHWRLGNKSTAKQYFDIAYNLSEKYPGTIPALTMEEKTSIETFLNIKPKND